ncbi:MAG: bile acid:sodium symporter family protein, partial [Pirellulaceae bacterium]|nr:bile acid:sodium symporter family protein [Pirellulaceae bacterium]
VLNVILALMMFGVSLGLRRADFVRIVRSPKAPAIGLLAQCILLPLLTFLLTLILRPQPSIALGMMLVAACPGGNFSNIMTFIARGSVAVSVSMTAVVSLLAVITTPTLFAFYARLNPNTADLVTEIQLEPLQMMALVLVVIAVPILLGMYCGGRFPKLQAKSEKTMRIVSLIIFFAFVVIAFSNNWDLFLSHYDKLVGLVLLHNSLALGLGYGLATLFGQPPADRRAITLEVGIQNSGLGLTLLFTFMPQLGGAILITAFWGIWHLVSGLALASYWGRRPLPEVTVVNA